MARCKSVYPGTVTLAGSRIRCESAAGHDGEHFHSFAMRAWLDPEDTDTCASCGAPDALYRHGADWYLCDRCAGPYTVTLTLRR